MFPLSMSGWFLGILVGMDQKDSFLMLRLRSSSTTTVAHFWLVLLVTNLVLCSFCFVRSITLGVMAGMDQKDSYVAKW